VPYLLERSLFFALVCVEGCSSSSAKSTLSVNQACDDFATNVCARLSACSPYTLQALYGNLATCTARTALSCQPPLGDPGTSDTASSVEACAQAIPAESCDDATNGKTPAACLPQPGQLEAGAPCGDNAQCATTTCYKPGTAVCGVCASSVAVSQSCAHAPCAMGLECAANQICVAPGTMGGACDTNQPCEATLVCTAGACAPPGALNAACSATASTCDPTQGLWCDPQGSTCQKVVLASGTGACGYANGTLTACSGSGVCKVAQGALTGNCVPPVTDGLPCDPTNGPGCLPPAVCVAGTCAVLQASCQ
jgi:hypothetical protein